MTRLAAVFPTVFCAAVAAVNVLHPVAHVFEEGALDNALGYLNALATQFATTRGPA